MIRLPVPPGLQNLVTKIEQALRLKLDARFSDLPGDYADDAAAAAGGVEVGEIYRTGSALKVRVS